MSVKLVLFKSFCLCFYNIAPWNKFRIEVMNKFLSCKCVKMFLGFTKYYSVTNTLLLTGLPIFDTVVRLVGKRTLARADVNKRILCCDWLGN